MRPLNSWPSPLTQPLAYSQLQPDSVQTVQSNEESSWQSLNSPPSSDSPCLPPPANQLFNTPVPSSPPAVFTPWYPWELHGTVTTSVAHWSVVSESLCTLALETWVVPSPLTASCQNTHPGKLSSPLSRHPRNKSPLEQEKLTPITDSSLVTSPSPQQSPCPSALPSSCPCTSARRTVVANNGPSTTTCNPRTTPKIKSTPRERRVITLPSTDTPFRRDSRYPPRFFFFSRSCFVVFLFYNSFARVFRKYIKSINWNENEIGSDWIGRDWIGSVSWQAWARSLLAGVYVGMDLPALFDFERLRVGWLDFGRNWRAGIMGFPRKC